MHHLAAAAAVAAAAPAISKGQVAPLAWRCAGLRASMYVHVTQAPSTAPPLPQKGRTQNQEVPGRICQHSPRKQYPVVPREVLFKVDALDEVQLAMLLQPCSACISDSFSLHMMQLQSSPLIAQTSKPKPPKLTRKESHSEMHCVSFFENPTH